MLIGFSKHGTGGAARPVQYLTAETVSAKPLDYLTGGSGKKGIRRDPAPVVVRGEPLRTKALIDSLSFKNKYTSGVLSFAPGEKITPEMEKSIVDQFERTAFAGLRPEQYDILWVRHQHTSGGRHELHFLTPRVELTTGKSLNIAPPRKSTREVFDTLRSKINAEFGLADPDDPARARPKSNRQPAFRAKLNQKAESKSKVELPIRPNLQRAVELETKLQTLVGARSEYHVKRYPTPSIENIAEPPKLISPFVPHDRTGTAPLGRAQALGISLHGARSGVCERVGRFDQAALGWSRANEHSQHTIAEFVPKARSVALCAEKEIVAYQGRAAASALLTKYLIPLRSRSDAPDHDIDMEMDMPI